MKIIFKILIIISLVILISCDGIIDDGGKIPIPPDPIPGHQEQKVSLYGDKLAFLSSYRKIIKILNFKTGEITNIIIADKMPKSMLFMGISRIYWAPYDNNKMLIHAVTSTDTVGDGKRYYYGQHLFYLSLDNFELTLITPKVLGSIGAAGMYVRVWLPESNNDKDLIQLSFSRDMYSSYKLEGQFLYIPQVDELKECQVKNILAFTKKETSFDPWRYFSFSIDYSNNYETIYSIDDYSAFFPIQRYKCKFDKKFSLTKASWSPNGKYLALSVTNIDNGPLNAIWLVDIENFLIDRSYILHPKQITFSEKDSLRLYYDVWAEFITDSTMAVSMYKSGDDFAYLWVITIDGKIVRQLTFEP